MIRGRLIVGLADMTLSEQLQMDPNLTLQRAIASARNSELMKRQQGTIRSAVKSYEIEAVRRETSRSSKNKDCPYCGVVELMSKADPKLTTVVVLNVAS